MERPGTVEPRPPSPRLLAVVGVFAGALAAGLGIGGGNLVVPLLAGFLSVPFKRAVGSSLLAMVPVAAVAVVEEAIAHPGNARFPLAGLLVLGAGAGAFAARPLVQRLPERPLAGAYAALLLLLGARLLGLLPVELESDRAPTTEVAAAGALALGAFAGATAVLFGIGGGVVVVPALVLLGGLPFHAARATSLAMVAGTSVLGVLAHRGLGTIDRSLAVPLVAGGAPGAIAGVLLANALPARALRVAFGLFLIVAAVRLARRALRGPAPDARGCKTAGRP